MKLYDMTGAAYLCADRWSGGFLRCHAEKPNRERHDVPLFFSVVEAQNYADEHGMEYVGLEW